MTLNLIKIYTDDSFKDINSRKHLFICNKLMYFYSVYCQRPVKLFGIEKMKLANKSYDKDQSPPWLRPLSQHHLMDNVKDGFHAMQRLNYC